MPLPPNSAWHEAGDDETSSSATLSSTSLAVPPKQAGSYSNNAAGGGGGLLSARGVKATNNGARRVRIAALDVGQDDDGGGDGSVSAAPAPSPPRHHQQPLPHLVLAPAPMLGRTVAHAATGAPSGRDVARLRGLVDEVTRLVAAGATFAPSPPRGATAAAAEAAAAVSPWRPPAGMFPWRRGSWNGTVDTSGGSGGAAKLSSEDALRPGGGGGGGGSGGGHRRNSSGGHGGHQRAPSSTVWPSVDGGLSVPESDWGGDDAEEDCCDERGDGGEGGGENGGTRTTTQPFSAVDGAAYASLKDAASRAFAEAMQQCPLQDTAAALGQLWTTLEAFMDRSVARVAEAGAAARAAIGQSSQKTKFFGSTLQFPARSVGILQW